MPSESAKSPRRSHSHERSKRSLCHARISEIAAMPTAAVTDTTAAAVPRRRRNSAMIAAETSGSSKMRTACDGIECMGASVLQRVELVDLDRLLLAEERDDDGEADRDLGGGDGEDEENEDA